MESIQRRVPAAALRYAIAGAVLGIALLHPLMEAVYWFGSHERMVTGSGAIWPVVARRLLLAFTPGMLPMTGLFGAIGAAVGLGFGIRLARLGPGPGPGLADRDSPGADIAALIAAGEGEHLEFKASARSDRQLGRPNRVLEESVARTMAAFLNHQGGTILIGVTDTGGLAGLQADYQTLKRPNRDGFQQFLMGLIESKLGGHVCAQVHVDFAAVRGQDVCRIRVEPSAAPVYFQDAAGARYFVRTGNGTRELDVREAVLHMARHQGQAAPGFAAGGRPSAAAGAPGPG